MSPKVLICGRLRWASEDAKKLFGDLAEIIELDSPDRADFLKGFEPGGKYDGVVAMYRSNGSASKIGVFDKELVNGLRGVQWIAHNGAGYDQIDVQACIAQNIRVSNTPGAVDEATATTALYLLISCLRQFSLASHTLRAGQWKPAVAPVARDLSCVTVGILGLGGIGLYLANLLRPFGTRVVYHNRKRNPDAPAWIEYVEDVGEMLRGVDVLSVHVPLNEKTEGLVGEEMIRTLKRGAVIVNTARGKVIDEAAMFRALEDGHLSSVGLDVFPDEPNVNPKWQEFQNVCLLPHMGTETRDSQHRMEVRALTNIRDFLVHGKGGDLVPEMKARG
ncbi:D-isomer specific 2-hydroxyacid dehydrogenase [Schizophyllum fasciatum]